ncbi:Phosphate transporter [Caenorhabditis elegans]|uniref:Phosphate transporter n=1 Tax=Caenorhabditis elegans TaxID=6239 RepID=Q17454_CAEEL|nr:Phosphate transporter [Caenorhabditis elegans]CCD61415.2 Phosphate transporter [Caenorhabditis elegans]|eukprot:NP_001343607.1 Phosphate transporter [Caenorhabditis elegans]
METTPVILSDITTTISGVIGDFDQSSVLWALIVGIILAFLLGNGMGANDVSNAFGTSVGSGVLTMVQAYILASIFEALGSILVGWSVADTMRKGVVDTSQYADDPKELLLGQVAILGGCAAWLLIATVLHMPVSTTHSLVGATIGFSIVLRGLEGIQWMTIVRIVCSWFLSPILSGIISSIIYMIVDHTVLRTGDPLKNGLRALPVFYFVCMAFNALVVFWDGSKLLHFNEIPAWGIAAIVIGVGCVAAALAHFVLKPRIKSNIKGSKVQSTPSRFSDVESANDSEKLKGLPEQKLQNVQQRKTPSGKIRKFYVWLLPDRTRVDGRNITKLFSTIQVFTACFAGFAHGANDVSNAIAPLAAIISIYRTKSVEQTESVPIYVLLYGVFAICVGLWLFGHYVIKTVGTNMSEINPASGFTIEFGAAMTSLLASKVGLPLSTTHCLVGSVVAVGMIRSENGVKWSIFRDIAISWVVTLPVSGLISAGIMFVIKWAVL